MIHCSNLYYHEYQGPLAARLAKATGLDRIFFCNSGTEAVEGGLKMIRAHGRKISPEKFETVALLDSFHGRTFGALLDDVGGKLSPRFRTDASRCALRALSQ